LDYSSRYAEITSTLKNISHDFLIDGEVVVLDKNGNPQFQLLQELDKDRSGLVYYVFDLLYFDGHDVRNEPLIERKRLLRLLVKGLANVIYSDHIIGRGVEFYKLIQQRALELKRKMVCMSLTGVVVG